MPVHLIGLRHTVSALSRSNKKQPLPFHKELPSYAVAVYPYDYVVTRVFPVVLLPFIRPFVLFLKSLLKSLSNDKALLLFERSEL